MHLLQIDWGPSEMLFSIGSFGIRYYSLMFVIGFLLGYNIVKKIYKNEHVNVEYVESLFMYVVIATLLGARLGEVFFYNWDYFQNHLVEILLPIKAVENASLFFGLIDGYEFVGYRGLASHGAAIGIISAMILYRRNYPYKTTLWILDRIVIPIALAAVLIRIGNFFNSEIVGNQTDSVFGIKFIRDRFSPREAFERTGIENSNEAYKAIQSNPQFTEVLAEVVPKHPAQLYEAFGYVFVFLILFYMYWKTDARNKQGLLFGTFLVTLWTVRFFVEYVKESQGGFENNPLFSALSTGQWLSIPFIIIGFYFILKSYKTT